MSGAHVAQSVAPGRMSDTVVARTSSVCGVAAPAAINRGLAICPTTRPAKTTGGSGGAAL